MGRTYDALLQAEGSRRERVAAETGGPGPRTFTIAVASPKGGVGKTTLALHLAVYLRALREDLPILAWNLDEQDTLDRGLLRGFSQADGEVAFHRGIGAALQLGEYGIDLIAAPRSGAALDAAIDSTGAIRRLLVQEEREGITILDTGSRLGRAAEAALVAADLVLVPMRDPVSLREGGKVWASRRRQATPKDIRAVLFGVDQRVKLTGPAPDILALLHHDLGRARRDYFATFVSDSPSVAGLSCAPSGRIRTVLHAAPESEIHDQMRRLATEVVEVAEGALMGKAAETRSRPLKTATEAPAVEAAPQPVPIPRPIAAERPPMARVPAKRPRRRGLLGSVIRRLTF